MIKFVYFRKKQAAILIEFLISFLTTLIGVMPASHFALSSAALLTSPRFADYMKIIDTPDIDGDLY